MNFRAVLKVLGFLLLAFSIAMIPPAMVSLFYMDGEFWSFINASIILVGIGLSFWLPNRKITVDLTSRDGFIIVLLYWLSVCLCGTVPLLLADALTIDFTNAFFESVSAITTTGATVITGLDDLPHSILYYRQQLQWFGGMGIIVLAVAILPMLGIGGMQLFKAEAPGPNKEDKLTPRITETAKSLWYIYVLLTVSCALAYWGAGMSFFDAICHSFSTIAIGGMSPHDASMAYFDSPLIEAICVFFLVVSGINFALHFMAWRYKSVWHYLQDAETRFFLLTLAFAIILIWISLVFYHVETSPLMSFRQSIFQVTSSLTTAGFTTVTFTTWPFHVGMLLVFLSFIGACAGSTCGGMKSIRIILVFKQSAREIYRLIHPRGVFTIRLNKAPVDNRILQSIWAFALVYIVVFLLVTQILLFTGLDFETAFSTSAAALNNLGPALGDAASNYAGINAVAKWVLCITMIMGRLEIFTLLVLFSPMFWRK